jgi:hypothetical protein
VGAENDEESPTFVWLVIGAAVGMEPAIEKLVGHLGAAVGIDRNVGLGVWTTVHCDVAGM